jgi:uncharacterized protein
VQARIHIPEEELAAFSKRWRIVELALFGSVLKEDFNSESDVDVLVRFDPEARHTLFDMVRMQDELKTVLARKVDLISRRAVEQSRNHIRRDSILKSAEVIYVA